MDKLKLKIDVTKIPREKIIERHYTNKVGHEVVVKEVSFEAVPKSEPKMIKEGDTWQLWETHFITIEQTKEEREQKLKGIIVGNAVMFKERKVEAEDVSQDIPYPEEELSADSIPF